MGNVANIKINEGSFGPRFSFRKNKGDGGHASSNGGEDPTPEELAEYLDKLSTTDQITEITEQQAWCKEHPHAQGMTARLRRIRLDEFLARRLQEAQQKLGHYHVPVQSGLQRRHQHGQTTTAQHAAQQAYHAQQAAIAAEAARVAAEAAAQAEAVRRLEESTRLTAQAAVAQRAVEAATQQVNHLETQLLSAQVATQEAIQLTQQCAAQRTDIERTLETVNDRVTQTVDHYAVILKEAKAHAAISVAEHKEMYAKPVPHLSTPRLNAADKFLRESSHIRTAARITAEHAKLQQATVLELQKANDELSQLAQQQVTHRTYAQEQTISAIERAVLTAANLTAHQIVAQQAAEAANTQLRDMIHRITSQQQAEAQQRATMVSRQTENPLTPEVPVDQALSRQLVEVQTRLSATQEKIQQTNQALAEIMAMETEAQHHKINDALLPKEPQMTMAFTHTLQALMQEYLLRKEQVELALEDNPLAEQAAIAIMQIVAAKEALKLAEIAWQPLALAGTTHYTPAVGYHPLAAARNNAMDAYQGALAIPYQALLQRKADKAAQQAEREVIQLTAQQAEATQNHHHLIDALADQTAIDTASDQLTALTTRLTTMQEQWREAIKEASRLATQDADAKYHAEYFTNLTLQKRSYSTVLVRKNCLNRAHYEKAADKITDDNLDVLWGKHYSNTLAYAIDAHSIQLEISHPNDGFAEHQAALQKMQTSPSNFNAALTSGLTLRSLELLFKYGHEKLIADDDANTLRLDDQSRDFATLLFALDLLYILIYHAPTIFDCRAVSYSIPQKSLIYLQHLLSSNPEIYQHSSARMSKRFHPEVYTIPTQTSASTARHDAPIHRTGISGWHFVESARLSLQGKAKLAIKRNQGFFKMTPEPREQSRLFVATDVQTNEQFNDWVRNIETTADSINLLDLPAEIRADIQTMSKTLDQTETVQRTMAM